MDRMNIKAPAKINLFLKILGKRQDGYHNILSWFQAVNLFDYLSFEKTERKGFELAIDRDSNLPTDSGNLITRAAGLLFERYDLQGGLKIRLTKNIPIAAGLGGGSSDAAATIYAINSLYELNLTGKELNDLGQAIGSDVPFFFSSGQGEVSGRGEIIKEIDLPTDYFIILVTPKLEISTGESYRRLNLGLTSNDANVKLYSCSNFKQLIDCIGDLGNDFESMHLQSYPVLGRIMDALNRAGAELTRMSGSGPTIFGLFKDMPEREDLIQITRGDWQLMTVRPITLPAWE
ncbi:MAG: 4-(cytidine 5'-diphospho)-2-C-methyl-D-erythritol kinase [candidate division Zixibacteria bacterium]|nr:4-(cytidine 5'-diphospho)-2-C-methyl-D-erythritol kinase [candidate division Zixibacteria bacterium]